MAIWRRVACWISKTTHAQAHASARAPTVIQTHTHRCVILFFHGTRRKVKVELQTHLTQKSAYDKEMLCLVGCLT
jgi:hypothetical protein